MTSLCLDPPAPFDFKQPDEWCRWQRRFKQFRLAFGLSSEGEEQQVCALLYCMGEGAEDTLVLTGISSEDTKKYQAVMAKFDTFFKVRKIVILSAPASIVGDKERMNQLNSLLQVYITLQKAVNMMNSKKR